MKSAAAMPPYHAARDPEPYRLRLAIAGTISLLVHALLLSLEFGIPGFGLPGLHAPWSERRAEDTGLQGQLAQANNATSAAAESAASPAQAVPNEASPSSSGGSPRASPQSAEPSHPIALPPSHRAALSSLVILPSDAKPVAQVPEAQSAPKRSSSAKTASKSPKQHKAASKARKAKRRSPALARKEPERPSGTRTASDILAQVANETDAFPVAPPDSTAPEDADTKEQSIEPVPGDPRHSESPGETIDAEEPLAAAAVEHEDTEIVEAMPPPVAQPQAPEPVTAATDEQQPMAEPHMQADDGRQAEPESTGMAERIAAQENAEEEEQREALAQQRQSEADEEARRLAEQEQEELRAREAQQLADSEREAAQHRAKLEAQQAELLARRQTEQRQEEIRQAELLAAQIKAEEKEKEAQRALAEQQRAELAAQEEEAAHQLQEQALQAAEARQAQQAALEQQELARAQALAAKTSDPGLTTMRQGSDSTHQSGQDHAQGAGSSADRASDASGDGPGIQDAGQPSSASSAGSSAAPAASPAANEPPDQNQDGPILLTDGQLDSIKVAQTRTIDKTRLDTWEVRQLEPDAPAARRRTLFGRVHDDIVLKMYIDDWERQIERDGNADRAPSGNKAGAPLVTVSVRSDGRLEQIAIDRPSGEPELDEAVRQIAHRHAYKPFPRDLARRYDVIEIRRVWDFKDRLRLREAAP